MHRRTRLEHGRHSEWVAPLVSHDIQLTPAEQFANGEEKRLWEHTLPGTLKLVNPLLQAQARMMLFSAKAHRTHTCIAKTLELNSFGGSGTASGLKRFTI